MPTLCIACGKPVLEIQNFCTNCGANLSGSAVQKVSVQPVQEEKNAVVAVVYSFFVPGLGQVYDGETRRGVGFLIGTVTGLFIFFIPGLIVASYGIYDAYSRAKKMNNGEIPFKPTRTAHLFIFFILGTCIEIIAIFMAIVIFILFTYAFIMTFT